MKTIIAKTASETSYSESDIRDFIIVTGMDLPEAIDVVRTLKKSGVRNLRDVIIIAKLGYFCA